MNGIQRVTTQRKQRALMFAVVILAIPGFAAGEEQLDKPADRYRIEIPATVLTDVPVDFVRITRLTPDGETDKTFHGTQVEIAGLRYATRNPETGRDKKDVALPAFQHGVLELKTDPILGTKVYIVSTEIVVEPESSLSVTKTVARTQRWFSIVPPLLAVILAIWLRNVLVALFAAVWTGAIILARGDFFSGLVRTLDTYVIGEIVTSDGGSHSHLLIILFTMFLGAMIGVMAKSGGMQSIVNSLSRFTKTREQGQVATWGMGFLVFFDDYANTLLVGGTMRPITDRLRISREKLAFLVDSTAAPVAGLALISTWVGYEVGTIEQAYQHLFAGTDIEWNAYSTFLATLFYRFYPLHLLVFVFLIAYMGHDFGPMLTAEARALKHGQLTRPGALVAADTDDVIPVETSKTPPIWLAVAPIIVLIALILTGLMWTGLDGLAASNAELLKNGKPEATANLWTILGNADSNRVMFLSAFVASMSAIAVAVMGRSMNVQSAVDAWSSGAKSMFLPLLVLVLAWSVATLCDKNHLNTAGFLVELMGGHVSASWMPALAFVLSGLVALSTGSSFTTMGLLMPLFINMTFYLLAAENDQFDPNHELLLATIGAILAGAIFGDHCSPISDTTVLSSAATGCDHLDHVATQFPYALTVAMISLVFGYVPVGFGISPIVMLPFGLISMFCIVQFIGKPVDKYAESLPEDSPDALAEQTEDGSDHGEAPPSKDTDDAPAEQVPKGEDLDKMDVDWDALPE